jgi:SAM-dependent methyltransferase
MSEAAEAHVDEFDVMAGWTAEGLAGRSPQRRIAGACNGSCSPAALAWLAESLQSDRGEPLLDVGCGLGGALAWAEDRYGVRGLGVEPMAAAADGAANLFGHRVLRGSADALPLAARCVPNAWMLGVLDTVPDPDAALGEVRRVLTDDGRFGLLAYVADAAIDPRDLPEGNHFPTHRELSGSLEAAGFAVLDRCGSDELPAPPLDWRLEDERADDEVEDAHGGDPVWSSAQRQRRAFAALLDDGRVRPFLLHAACV